MAKSFSDLRKAFPSTDYYLMFCYLLGKQNEDGEIHITKKEMEQETGYSWRQVKRFLDWFEQQRGIVSVLKSGCNGGCNYYIENEYLSTLCGSKTYSIVVAIQKEEKPVNPARIIPPRLEDVKAYIQENNLDLNAEYWYNSYAAKGWMIGKSKMKDWHRAIATWVGSKNKKTDTEPRPKSVQDVHAYFQEQGFKDLDAQYFFDFYETNGWMQNNKPIQDWKACARTWELSRKNNTLPFNKQTEQPKEWVDPLKEQYEKFLPWCRKIYPEYVDLITFEVFKKMMRGATKEFFFVTLKRMYESGFRGSDILKEYLTYN